MNTTQTTEAHHPTHGPHPGLLASIYYETLLTPPPEKAQTNRSATTAVKNQITGLCSIVNFATTDSRAYLSTGDVGTGRGGPGGGTGTGGTGTGGTGTGGTGTGGSGTGGTGTGGTGTGDGGTGTGGTGTGTGGTGIRHTGTGGTDTGGTGTGSTGTGRTGTGDTGAGTGHSGTGVRMANTRLVSLKLKRKNQFRVMSARLQSGARSFIGNFQQLIGLTNKKGTSNVTEFLEFDGLGIS